jgi:hypothetical protein
MLLLLQGKSGTELGGAAVPCIFDTCWKVQRTLKSSSNFDRTPNGTFRFVKYVKFAKSNFWPKLELNNPGMLYPVIPLTVLANP